MGEDDATARRERAKSLHSLIKQIKRPGEGIGPVKPESPGRYVERKMRELTLHLKNRSKKAG